MVPSRQLNRITSLEMVYCSSFAAPLTEINKEVSYKALSILRSMPNLRKLRLLLPDGCWHDFFYDLNPSTRLDSSNAYVRNYIYYGQPRAVYGWRDVVPYLEWLKDLACAEGVIVTIYEQKRSRYKPDINPHMYRINNKMNVMDLVLRKGEWALSRSIILDFDRHHSRFPSRPI